MRNILRLRVLGILLLALGLFGGTVATASADDATPPADSSVGSLSVAAFTSDQVSVPTITEGYATADNEGGAGFTEASFELYINGDTSSDSWWTFTTTDGNAQVNDFVPVGVHTLILTDSSWDSPYSYAWDVEVFAGTGTFVTVLIPSGETPGISNSGSLVLSSYGADQVGNTKFLVSDPINIAPQAPIDQNLGFAEDDLADAGYAGAYTVDRQFLIYVNGDTNSAALSLQTIGGTALYDNLPAGTHVLADAQTGESISFTIASGSVTTVVAVFPEGYGDTGEPGDRDVDAPGADDDGADTGDDNGDGDDDGGKADGGNTGGGVSKLPSTGQGGNSTDSSAIVMILGAMSLVALAGGFAWRQRRTA
jgi:hypothetical protein